MSSNENDAIVTRSISDKLKIKKKASRSGRDYYKIPDSLEADVIEKKEGKEGKEGKESKESPVARRKSSSHPLKSVSSSESNSNLGTKKSSVEQRIHEYDFFLVI